MPTPWRNTALSTQARPPSSEAAVTARQRRIPNAIDAEMMRRPAAESHMRIVGPNFVAGLVIKDDRVIHAAPILSYTIGWTTERVSALAQRRGWTIEHAP
jgi:hypothetical protein